MHLLMASGLCCHTNSRYLKETNQLCIKNTHRYREEIPTSRKRRSNLFFRSITFYHFLTCFLYHFVSPFNLFFQSITSITSVFQWLTPGWAWRSSPTPFCIWSFSCWNWRCDNKFNFDARKLLIHHFSLNTALTPFSNCNVKRRKRHVH